MSDVFISYAREDRACASALAEALKREGFSVWWDREIVTGQTYDRAIEEALDQARCVLVIWSRNSVDSNWVRTEAADGLERGILLPVRVEPTVRPPLQFRLLETLDLPDWEHGTLGTLVADVSSHIGRQGDADALYDLAIRHLHGQGVPRDDDRARALLRRAAEKGCLDAEDILWRLAHEEGDEPDG